MTLVTQYHDLYKKNLDQIFSSEIFFSMLCLKLNQDIYFHLQTIQTIETNLIRRSLMLSTRFAATSAIFLKRNFWKWINRTVNLFSKFYYKCQYHWQTIQHLTCSSICCSAVVLLCSRLLASSSIFVSFLFAALTSWLVTD